jgi:hypothetical protein
MTLFSMLVSSATVRAEELSTLDLCLNARNSCKAALEDSKAEAKECCDFMKDVRAKNDVAWNVGIKNAQPDGVSTEVKLGLGAIGGVLLWEILRAAFKAAGR